MATYNTISLAQIDADALADYIVSSKRLVYRRADDGDESIVASNIAQDVEKVAGTNAENIAIAINSDNRDTVQNALKLNGIDADQYMMTSTGNSIQTKQIKMRKLYGDDLQNIKDELYTLRQELAKGGFIEDRGEYTGYVDIFRAAAPKHLFSKLAVVTTTGNADEIFVEDEDVFDSLDIYDYIVLEAEDVQKFTIKQIAEKDKTRRVLILDSEIRGDVYSAENGMNLYLSYGINDEGMFKFARAAELMMASEENHTGLSDDTYKIMKHVTEPNKGFAYSFRVPEEKQGYVTSFEICAKAYGTPGSMICYLMDARDVENFHNPVQAASDYQTALANKDDSFHFFAASKPYVLSSAYGRRYIKFDFLQDNDMYPIMSQDEDDTVRYVAIVECLDCDQNNYYDIQFLQHKNSEGHLSDLELNNITYHYERQKDGSSKLALTTDDAINASDMYYHIVTRSIVEKEVYPEDKGLYSFRIETKDLVNKARVMLRIRREGIWKAITGTPKAEAFYNKTITIQDADPTNGIRTIPKLQLKSQTYKPLELRENNVDTTEQVLTVIGNNITSAHSLEESAVTFDDPVVLKDGDPIYRMGYLVSLKARKVSLQNGHLTATPYRHFVLPLTEVFKDFRRTDKMSSDRLLFEANLFDIEATDDDYFNDFIVQVYWSNTDMETNDYPDIRKAQMGAIKDIAVSFNEGY